MKIYPYNGKLPKIGRNCMIADSVVLIGDIEIAILATDPHWLVVLEALGNPQELAGDPRFADHWNRCTHAREATAILDPIFASRPRDYWLDRLVAKGDLPVCAINTTEEAANDPQALANGYVTELDHPSHGKIRLPGFPVALSETPARIHCQAPEFGEHTEQVLVDLLGMDWDRLNGLRDRKVI